MGVEDDEPLLQWFYVDKAIQSSEEAEFTIAGINALITQNANTGWMHVGTGPSPQHDALAINYSIILVSEFRENQGKRLGSKLGDASKKADTPTPCQLQEHPQKMLRLSINVHTIDKGSKATLNCDLPPSSG
ncbi:hypothetical protein WISP_31556 [Willisornis vidua]|uniref:Uncharacterized protein n=1 Tax=Willisornis vidua TaxID=1566151 RepID=A0ABQ9DMY3_9PASS|nr:hypothetical protein WISP_31556 [Willisornis vidua]